MWRFSQSTQVTAFQSPLKALGVAAPTAHGGANHVDRAVGHSCYTEQTSSTWNRKRLRMKYFGPGRRCRGWSWRTSRRTGARLVGSRRYLRRWGGTDETSIELAAYP